MNRRPSPRSLAPLATRILGLLVAQLVATSPAFAVLPDALSVEREGTLVTIHARNASVRGILAELARAGSFEIVEVLPAEGSISVTVERQPLDRTIRRILASAGVSFVLLYDSASPPRLRRLLVLGVRQEAVLHDEGEDSGETTSTDGVVRPDTTSPIEDLLELADHPDQRTRSGALEVLSNHPDDERARQTLVDKTTDPDPRVRSVALGTIGRNLVRWLGAEGSALRALYDPEPSVRLLALQLLWEAHAPRLSEALAIGASDGDAAIRSRAEELRRRGPGLATD